MRAPPDELADVQRCAESPLLMLHRLRLCPHESRTEACERKDQGTRAGLQQQSQLGAVQSRLDCAGCGGLSFSRLEDGRGKCEAEAAGAGCGRERIPKTDHLRQWPGTSAWPCSCE